MPACRPDALPHRFHRPAPTSTAVLPGLPVMAAGPCPPAAIRTLCHTDSITQSPSARLCCRGFPSWPRARARTLPSGRSATPIPSPSPHQHGCAAGASRHGCGPVPARRARFCLFAVARRCAGCLSWCAAPAFCSRRPCCRSAGQRALPQSGCRSGTACRAAPSCRQTTAG